MLELNKPILNKNNRLEEFLHILVVDDDSRIRSLCPGFLLRRGIE